MKMNLALSLTILMVGLFVGCKEDESPTSTVSPLQGHPFEIRAWNYSTNYFFVDTLYRSFYEPYYSAEPPMVNPTTQIIQEEVWVQRQGPIPDANEAEGRAFISLPPRPPEGYDSTLRQPYQIPGQRESGAFIRLNRSQYEMVGDGYLGVVCLRTPVVDQMVISIAYRRADGSQFGDFARDLHGIPSVLILKMLKPRNLNATGRNYPVAWNQLLKNVYSVGSHDVREVGFELNVLYGQGLSSQILNQPLLRILGLDRFNQDGTLASGGDGLFDFRPARTVDQANGDIILPFLRPFDQGIRAYFISQGLSLPDSIYYSPEIYDTTKTVAQIGRGNNFSLSGRALNY